jgi:hypothetical protein
MIGFLGSLYKKIKQDGAIYFGPYPCKEVRDVIKAYPSIYPVGDAVIVPSKRGRGHAYSMIWVDAMGHAYLMLTRRHTGD